MYTILEGWLREAETLGKDCIGRESASRQTVKAKVLVWRR